MMYKYTTPRRPISAMTTSPGPMQYVMPTMLGHVRHDPRSGVPRQPAFTFGMSLASARCLHRSPGFRALTDKVYRTGKETTFQPSIIGRPSGAGPPPTPSPQVYRTMRADVIVFQRPPAHTFGCQFRRKSLTLTPAPNAYQLPPVMGPGQVPDGTKRTCPKYTMRPKCARGGFAEDMSKAPGPGTYDETSTSVYKNRLPHYSMAARIYTSGDPSQKPGPGAHRPEDYNNMKKEYPSYTFGIKHSQYAGIPVMEPTDD